MCPEDDPRAGNFPDPLDQLRHDLRTPLTTIRGRASLLGRAVRRSSSLNDAERTRMLDGLAAIEAAVLVLVAVINGMSREPTDGGGDGTADPS